MTITVNGISSDTVFDIIDMTKNALTEIGTLNFVPNKGLRYILIFFISLSIALVIYQKFKQSRPNVHGHVCKERRGIKKYYISCPGINPKFSTFHECYNHGKCS